MKFDSLIALAESLKIKYCLNEAMSLHTSFKIGGAADIMLYPENEEYLEKDTNFKLKEQNQDNNISKIEDNKITLNRIGAGKTAESQSLYVTSQYDKIVPQRSTICQRKVPHIWKMN